MTQSTLTSGSVTFVILYHNPVDNAKLQCMEFVELLTDQGEFHHGWTLEKTEFLSQIVIQFP